MSRVLPPPYHLPSLHPLGILAGQPAAPSSMGAAPFLLFSNTPRQSQAAAPRQLLRAPPSCAALVAHRMQCYSPSTPSTMWPSSTSTPAPVRSSAGCPVTWCSSRTPWEGRSTSLSNYSSHSLAASRWRLRRGGSSRSSCSPPSRCLSLVDHPSNNCYFAPSVEALQARLPPHPLHQPLATAIQARSHVSARRRSV
jgi:hypothetical protein